MRFFYVPLPPGFLYGIIKEMMTYLIPFVFLAAALVWQGVTGYAPSFMGNQSPEQEEVLGVQDTVTVSETSPTPSVPGEISEQGGPSPHSTGSVKAITITSTATPTPTASPSPALTDDCDYEYHYDSRDDGDYDGDVSVRHHCEKKTENNGSVSNNVDINVNTGGHEGTSGDVKVDLSVKNTAD